MKQIKVFFMVAMATLMIGCTPSETPEEVVQKFASYLSQGRVNEARELLTGKELISNFNKTMDFWEGSLIIPTEIKTAGHDSKEASEAVLNFFKNNDMVGYK